MERVLAADDKRHHIIETYLADLQHALPNAPLEHEYPVGYGEDVGNTLRDKQDG